MSKWSIYHKDGSLLTDVNNEDITIKGLEYSDSWMGECFLTISSKNPAPINFEIGDFIIYRGERFELNYDPGKEKQARKDAYGEGFVYDSIKFNALQDELARTEFLDVVLNDNQLHYTSLPKFPFYVQTIDDLLDRIQANLNEQIGVGSWKIFSRNKERSMQRGCTAEEWDAAYGDGTSDLTDFDSKSITIDSKTCWEALMLVNTEWNINFIIRNRCIYVGTAGVTTQNIFKYGLGKGLYEIDQNADSEQSIITRLRAYGSEKNLPEHYYADLGIKYKANITKVKEASTFVEFVLDLDYIDTYFKDPRKFKNYSSTQEQTYGWVLRVTFDYKTIVTGYVTKGEDGKCRFYSELKGTQYDNGDEESKEVLDAFIAQVKEGNTLLYISSGINKKTIPYENKEYANNLPNNMSINRLMLPGFPHLSLKEFWDSLTDEEKKYVNPSGREHVFSTDKYRPYIDSINLEKIGLRSASQFFDTDDKTNGVIEIYPTIEEMEIGGVRVDEIYTGTNVDDDGRYDTESPKNIDIYLNPAIDFDINDLRDDDFSISMKDGMCGGRDFKVASCSKIYGKWRLTIERVKDDALNLWFPYKDYQIKKGDHFVLTGIELPDSYIRAASLKLLKYAIALLDKNDYTRYVYQPKVDEIFMARQHDQAMDDKTGTIKSLHDTLKAGDLMRFEDEDLGIDAEITIDQLTIKEEDGKIPTYDITLREDKEVGTIQKIQQQISSLQSGNGGTGAGLTTTQVKNQVAAEGSKHFISKITDDTAKGTVTWEKVQKFLQGILIGNNNAYSIDANGNVTINLLNSADYDDAMQSGFGFYKRKDGKYGLNVTDLSVWGKAYFNNLTIRELTYVGGNLVFSPSAGKIFEVREITDAQGEVTGWKCYLLADDGTTATTNMFEVDDQVRCETFNIKAGVYENVSNKFYWRKITDVSTDNEEIRDSNNNILYDGKKFSWIVISASDKAEGSDNPAAGDTIVLMGNRTSTNRMSFVVKETYGDNAPREVGYTNVHSYTLGNGNLVYEISPKKVRFYSQYFEIVTIEGLPIKTINYRGDWKKGDTYVYYDQVTHNGTTWLCVAPEGTNVTSEPARGNDFWKAQNAILDATLNITQSTGEWIDKGETNHVECSVIRGFENITDQVTSWNIVRDSGDAVNDAAWQNKDKVKNFDGTIDIAWTDDDDDIGDSNSCIFTITAFWGNKVELAKGTISV